LEAKFSDHEFRGLRQWVHQREAPIVDLENWTSNLPYLRNGTRSFKVTTFMVPMESLYVTS